MSDVHLNATNRITTLQEPLQLTMTERVNNPLHNQNVERFFLRK